MLAIETGSDSMMPPVYWRRVVKDRVHKVVTADRLRDVLSYEPETGEFRWIVKTGPRGQIGSLAGCLNGNGYRIIAIDGISYRASRLAWLYMKGVWPINEIDHDDRKRDNDKWSNLIEKTSSEQKRNTGRRYDNSSGFRGVSFHKPSGKYRARLQIEGKEYCSRYFETPELAAAARDEMYRSHGLNPAIDEQASDVDLDGKIAPVMFETDANLVICCDICEVPVNRDVGEYLVADVDPSTGKIKRCVCKTCKKAINIARKDPDLIWAFAALASCQWHDPLFPETKGRIE